MLKGRRIPLPKGKYVEQIEVNDENVHLTFKKKQKVALLFICLNERYWPYLVQVMKDCKEKFLPHHNVDFFLWTDIENYSEVYKTFRNEIDTRMAKAASVSSEHLLREVTDVLIPLFARYITYTGTQEVLKSLADQGVMFRRDEEKMWIETARTPDVLLAELLAASGKKILDDFALEVENVKKLSTIETTEAIEWPYPTLMRYHLFLNQEEKLKEYDSIFYLDSDMRVLEKISDEILSSGLTAAEHPMYSLKREYVPPYEPNEKSTAYIPRPGKVIEEKGKKRFKPYYYAGGFQGGSARPFLRAMREMKKNIDKDFNNNYTAVWNDESHWNKYLSTYKGDITVLSPAYVYPDSLIDEYYAKIWEEKYQPKIMTLTKPFSLSKEGGDHVRKFIKES